MAPIHFTLNLGLAMVEIRLWPDLPLEIWHNPVPVRFGKSKSGTALIGFILMSEEQESGCANSLH